MQRIGLSVVAFVVGTIALFAVQIAQTRVWSLADVTWGPGNLPLSSIPQVAALMTVFGAVFAGSLVAAVISGRDKWLVLTVMCLVGVFIDGYFMFVDVGDALPLWFRLSFVTLIPIATVIAGLVSNRLRPERSESVRPM